jgi:hypothetical protein
MSKRAGAYKSEKRKKELMRIKKQEEKRKRRLSKVEGATPDEGTEDQAEGAEQSEIEEPAQEPEKEEEPAAG